MIVFIQCCNVYYYIQYNIHLLSLISIIVFNKFVLIQWTFIYTSLKLTDLKIILGEDDNFELQIKISILKH